MLRLTVFTIVFLGMTHSWASDAKSSDVCVAAVTGQEVAPNFPILDVNNLPNIEVKKEGSILPVEVKYHDGQRVTSSIPTPSAFFAANYLSQFATLDARNSQAFSQSAPISFLRDFGLKEMSLLGPDLTKKDPFLDMKADPKSPSEDKVDETNATLQALTEKMTQLLGNDQRSALQNLLRGNVSQSIDQIEAKMRLVLAKFTFTSQMFGSFVSDKKFLIDIQNLLAGNYVQFNEDLVFIEELQGRYRKTRDALDKLRRDAEGVAQMKTAVLATITDEYTKDQVGKEFVRFEQRATDLASGVAICETFINMWEVIKDNHIELVSGIQRAMNFTVPIIGAQQQLINALKRQERTRVAIRTMDNTRNIMIQQMNDLMQKSVATQQAHELQAIKDDAENLGKLLVGTIMVQQAVEAHNVQKVAALQAARKRYDEITAQARAQRKETIP